MILLQTRSEGTVFALLTFILLTAIARSAGVKNQALVGESGKRNLRLVSAPPLDFKRRDVVYQNAIAVNKVRRPVMIISLGKPHQWPSRHTRIGTTNHCHGSKDFVLMCSVPKLMNPEIIWAARNDHPRRSDVILH